MLKSSLLAACLLGSVAFATAVSFADDAKPAAAKPKPDKPTVGCTQETGSRLPPKKDSCAGVGRSYSRDDIDRTGAVTAGGALRLMDPSVSGH
jgi:hypothetical protein